MSKMNPYLLLPPGLDPVEGITENFLSKNDVIWYWNGVYRRGLSTTDDKTIDAILANQPVELLILMKPLNRNVTQKEVEESPRDFVQPE